MEEAGTTRNDLGGDNEDDRRRWGPADTTGWKIGAKIHFYWLPVIIPLGFVGNALSLSVLLKPRNRAISCCVYMSALAVCDCGMLSVATHYFIRSVQVVLLSDNDMNTSSFSEMECRVFTWFFQMFSLSGVCIIISMTADRLIGVRFPLRALSLCTVSRAQKTVLCIPLFTAVYTIPYLLLSKFVGPTCVALAIETRFTVAYSWVTICLNCFIPFLCILGMNSAMITTIRQRMKNNLAESIGTRDIHLQESTSPQPRTESATPRSATKPRKRDSREKQLVFMLLLISFSFIVLTLPLFVRYLLYQYLDKSSTYHAASTFYLVFHVTNKMFHTNSAINFILYCIGGSKFRKDVRDLFHCCDKKARNGAISGKYPSSSASLTSSVSNVSG